jgi:hypothetical protein
MQNRGSALAFLFVLSLMCLGTYAAVSTLMKGRSSNVIALEALTPTPAGETTPTSSIPVPTDTPVETPSPQPEVSTPVAPTATPIPPATPTSPPQPTPTPTRSVASPTPVPPVEGHLFRAVRNERDCSTGRLIAGSVYDADGNGLPGISIRIYNDYGWSPPPRLSEGPPQIGKYEFTMGFDAGVFHLLIVDNVGQSLSAEVDVNYEPACSYYIDWQRMP